MTDKELKKHLKKLAIVLIAIFLVIGILLIYTLKNKKAELSIYTNAKGDTQNLQALGINEAEFMGYLSLFGNLVDENYNENQRTLNMAIYFLENMSSYEPQTDENGLKVYDADLVNQIAKEMQGIYIKENIADDQIYVYQKEKNCYLQKQNLNQMLDCIQIDEISKTGDKIEVIYTLTIMTKEQVAEYKTEASKKPETHQVKAVIMKNSEYEYSKYFITSIEEL